MNLTHKSFGTTEDGKAVDLFSLANNRGLEAAITTYGGIIVSLLTPDRQGNRADIVLGFDRLEDYLRRHPYFGAIVGRYANRIAQGKFILNGAKYNLAQNNGPNHLHGGIRGFDKAVWQAKAVEGKEGPSLKLSYLSRDGEEGYPGNLAVEVIYTVTAENELKIDYRATTDQATVLNLTNHSYFNLAGAGAGDILNHKVMIKADRFTPVTEKLIPTGELRPVAGTPLDFSQPLPIGARINNDDDQLQRAGGYDHNFVLNTAGNLTEVAARVHEPSTGRTLELYTTQPGVQFYTGNFLDGSLAGKGGHVYHRRSGFCLETQHFPDSPNRPDFPSTVLRPEETYRQTTIYKFR